MKRTVDDLPLEPTTWIEAKRRWGMPERGHQPVHAVQAEPHAEQLEAEQVVLGLAEGHRPRLSSARR